MKLHDPGPGEILDRLTILALKIVHGGQAGRDTTHWEYEREQLYALLVAPKGVITLQLVEIAAVNAALWQAEDELRAWRRGDLMGDEANARGVGACGMRIQQLNDRRAELVTLINASAGRPAVSDKH